MNDDIIAILNKLCRYKLTADKAITYLYRLAISDIDLKDDAIISLRNMFFAYFSNNALNAEKRIDLLVSFKKEYGITVPLIHIYGSMLKADKFYGSISNELGEDNYQDYNIVNEDELKLYYDYAFESLTSALEIDETLLYELVKEKIIERLQEQFIQGESESILHIVNAIAVREKKLPVKLRGRLDSLLVSSNRLSDDKKSAIEKFLEDYTIKNVSDELDTVLINAPYLSERNVQGEYHDIAKERAQNLAERYIKEKTDWESYLPSLLIDQQKQTFHFAEKIGQSRYPHKELLQKAIKFYKSIEIDRHNYLFINGLVYGVDKNDFTRNVIVHSLSHKNTISIGVHQTRFLKPILLEDLNRIRPYLIQEPNYLRLLEYMDLVHLEDKEMIELFLWLKDINLSFSLEIIENIIRKQPERWMAFEEHVNPHLFTKGVLEISNFINSSVHIEQLIKRSIKSDPAPEKIEFILKEIIECYKDFHFHNETLLNYLVYFFLENYWDKSWPLLGKHITEMQHIPHGLSYLLSSFPYDNSELLKWVEEEPESRAEVAMRFMQLFVKESIVKGKPEFQPEIIELIDKYGHNQKMLDRLESKLTSYSINSISAENLYLKRKELIGILSAHPIEEVKYFSSQMTAKFDLLIERERNTEQNYNLGI
ncbi:hypothetical protein [Cellulophaga sp. Hel_I_12]|uniref:hypothetical protein n=1 Tax=Cellulophaga sp. Hel_I_12 TaxID=1249972 RepID=UPI0006480CC8|nr:hypothetical protein [Cellulophaga sp. Hel_I_12]